MDCPEAMEIFVDKTFGVGGIIAEIKYCPKGRTNRTSEDTLRKRVNRKTNSILTENP